MKAKTVNIKPPTGKSLSARARAHDWARLLDIVSADRHAFPALNFEDQYTHAIELALVGRKIKPLLKLLDDGEILHPALLPALADVIRSQTDGARGTPARLTEHQNRMIRQLFKSFTADNIVGRRREQMKMGELRQWLADKFKVSVATIERSLNHTKSAK
jgi:hypothetical protein